MDNKNTNPLPYSKVNINLSTEAMDFLSETSNGTSHFTILSQLIKNTCTQASTTSKRGNTINLKVGQVECSVHSYCEKFGIKRKKFESIMRRMEQLGVIRMHRSRLATVANMLCIDSWLLNDDTVLSNDIKYSSCSPTVHHADKQPTDGVTVTPEVVSVPKSSVFASSDCRIQSPADTEPDCPQEPTTSPITEKPSGTSANSHTGYQPSQALPQPAEPGLFDDQYKADSSPNKGV